MDDRRLDQCAPYEIEMMRRTLQSERCAEEIADIQARPIDNVRYNTITTVTVEGEELLVLEFDLKKYDAVLTVTLPKLYPSVPPVLVFDYKKIPSHPNVDAKTGRVRGFWMMNGKWTREMKIRDLCGAVAGMLAEANTPETPEPQKDVEDNELRFWLTGNEFRFLCEKGKSFIDDLRLRYPCVIKYKYPKKNRQNERPCLLLSSKIKLTRETVAAAVDGYLVNEKVRTKHQFKIDPEPSAEDFVGQRSFNAPSVVVVPNQDLIELAEGDGPRNVERSISGQEKISDQVHEYGDGDNNDYQECSGEMRRLVNSVKESLQDQNMKIVETYAEFLNVADAVKVAVRSVGEKAFSLASFVTYYETVNGDQRRQAHEYEQRLQSAENSLNKFRCPVCVNRFVGTRLECGHGFCQPCGEGSKNTCYICQVKNRSQLGLYF